jgi:phage terminase large subunit GpA-like protein
MQTFFEIYERYLEALEDPEGLRSFINLYKGWPYKETGYRPPLESIIELRGEYRAGTVPDDVIILTAGIDVQGGTKGDPDNPPRLEMEVCGHGLGYRTWSIDYKVFEGSVDNEDEGAWLELTNWARESGFGFHDKNKVFHPIRMTFIDSGFKTDVVYNFTSRWEATYPSKGFQVLKPRKKEKGDEADRYNFIKYRRAKMAGETILYEISTNYYKNITYSNLNIKRNDFPPQPTRFCSFPIDYGSKYFNMLRAEERRVDGSFHDFNRRNEALDCRVMNICAAQAFLDAWVNDLRDFVKRQGASKEEIGKIRSDTVLIQRPWEFIKREA